jgi:hypothetical protein
MMTQQGIVCTSAEAQVEIIPDIALTHKSQHTTMTDTLQGISIIVTPTQQPRSKRNPPNTYRDNGQLSLPIMQGELPMHNLADGLVNPYPLAMKPRDLQQHKCDAHLSEIKYCVDTSPNQQSEKAREQHKLSMPRLLRHHKTLHTILLGATGTIYRSHTKNPLRSLGVTGLHATILVKMLSLRAINP